jgi:hypothetical protein
VALRSYIRRKDRHVLILTRQLERAKSGRTQARSLLTRGKVKISPQPTPNTLMALVRSADANRY